MKAEDWKCLHCGEVMEKTSDRYMACPCYPCYQSKLRPLWSIGDLSVATRFDYKRFTIAEEEGYWEYVPHMHKGCLDRAPVGDCVVAKVRHDRRSTQAMTFRPCKTPLGGEVRKVMIDQTGTIDARPPFWTAPLDWFGWVFK